MEDIPALTGLLFASFLAATILPAQSEAVLSALILLDQQSTVLLVTVASIGNIAGSIVNWFLGRGLGRLSTKKWFPVKAHMLKRAIDWYRKYGRWSLLISWMPIVGDPITVAAGFLREPIWSFVVLVAVGKISRYIILAYGVTQLT